MNLLQRKKVSRMTKHTGYFFVVLQRLGRHFPGKMIGVQQVV